MKWFIIKNQFSTTIYHHEAWNASKLNHYLASPTSEDTEQFFLKHDHKLLDLSSSLTKFIHQLKFVIEWNNAVHYRQSSLKNAFQQNWGKSNRWCGNMVDSGKSLDKFFSELCHHFTYCLEMSLSLQLAVCLFYFKRRWLMWPYHFFWRNLFWSLLHWRYFKTEKFYIWCRPKTLLLRHAMDAQRNYFIFVAYWYFCKLSPKRLLACQWAYQGLLVKVQLHNSAHPNSTQMLLSITRNLQHHASLAHHNLNRWVGVYNDVTYIP